MLSHLLLSWLISALSLWLDEGITVMVVRLPWPDVLGLHGAYESHPPFYFVLTKLATIFAPEVCSARNSFASMRGVS